MQNTICKNIFTDQGYLRICISGDNLNAKFESNRRNLSIYIIHVRQSKCDTYVVFIVLVIIQRR